MDLRAVLKELDVCKLWETPEDKYMNEILDDIDKWLEDESEMQNWIEENLRSKDE